jgi:hypothetical protein
VNGDRKPIRSAFASRLLSRTPPTPLELALFGALLLAVTAGVYGSHIFTGGFFSDDYAFARIYEYAPDPGFFSGIDHYIESQPNITNRPLQAVFEAVIQELIGMDVKLGLAWTVVAGALASWSLYLLLRMLSIEPLHAGLISVLVLVFPASDAIKLWLTTSVITVVMALYFLGVALALHAFGKRGPGAIALHALSVLLYLASVALYEAAFAAIVLAPLLYLTRVSREIALRRWLADVVVVGTWALLVTSNSPFPTYSLSGQIDHAWQIAGQAIDILIGTAIPLGDGAPRVLVLLLVGLVAAAVYIWRRLDPNDPIGLDLRRWLLIGAGGVVPLIAAYAVFVPSVGYSPLSPGFGNRVNALATPGYMIIVYSLLMIGGILAFRSFPDSRRWAAGLAALVAIALGAEYVSEVDRDKGLYARAHDEIERVLGTIEGSVPTPAPGSTLYAFEQPIEVAPGVPVFGLSFGDFDSALILLWDQPQLRAFPHFPGTVFECLGDRLQASGHPAYGPTFHPSPYGLTVFVNSRSGIYTVISNRKQCRAAVRRYAPGSPPPPKRSPSLPS